MQSMYAYNLHVGYTVKCVILPQSLLVFYWPLFFTICKWRATDHRHHQKYTKGF